MLSPLAYSLIDMCDASYSTDLWLDSLSAHAQEKGDLYTLLGKYQGRFAWHKLGRYVALDVARGLAFLHSRNIVHFECEFLSSAGIIGWSLICQVQLCIVLALDKFQHVRRPSHDTPGGCLPLQSVLAGVMSAKGEC